MQQSQSKYANGQNCKPKFSSGAKITSLSFGVVVVEVVIYIQRSCSVLCVVCWRAACRIPRTAVRGKTEEDCGYC